LFNIQAAKRSFCFWFSFLPSGPILPHHSSLIQNCRLMLSGAVVRSFASSAVRNSKAAELLGPYGFSFTMPAWRLPSRAKLMNWSETSRFFDPLTRHQ